MKSFEDVLAAGGPLVASWDHDDSSRTLLSLFSIASATITMEASARVPLDVQEAMVERLLTLGLRIGGNYGGSEFVWSADDREFSIWSDEATCNIPRGKPVVGVTVFYGEGVVHRGVRLALADGSFEIVAEERDPFPRLDPVYDAHDLEDDTRWARCLGEYLAVWFLCPLHDELFPTTIEPELAIARTLRGLADEVAASSAEIVRSLGPIGAARKLVYRCTVDTLEIDVAGTTTTTAALKHGTRAQIAAFLRRVSTPATTLWVMNDLLNKQAQP